jgi:pyruvate,water dikinase
MGFTRPLGELRCADAAEFGGKSANLGDLIAAGVRAPAGFAVGVDAFRAFVEEAGLEATLAARLRDVASGGVDAVEAASRAIGEAMRLAPLAAVVHAELRRAYGQLARATGVDRPAVAVRSSALGEDGEDASHAGQQDTFLWVQGLEQVCDAVRDCWVSLYTPRAIAYRGGDATAAMGVTVQHMVDAEISGVLFTCNPVSGDPSMIAVNASWGLGIAVVGGEVTPDDYLVSKVTGEVVRRSVSTKAVEYVHDPAGVGAVRIDVDVGRRDEPCLGDAELAALVDAGRGLERHFGSHQDVEWAIERGRSLPDSLHVLQSRPVTRLPERARTPSGSALSLVMSTFGAVPGNAKRR